MEIFRLLGYFILPTILTVVAISMAKKGKNGKIVAIVNIVLEVLATIGNFAQGLDGLIIIKSLISMGIAVTGLRVVINNSEQ